MVKSVETVGVVVVDSGYNVKREIINLEEIVSGGSATWLEPLVPHSAVCHLSL